MRTEDDSWDVTEGVGGTAIQVAMGRMAETASVDPLFRDRHAQHLVEAALARGWVPPFSAEILAQLEANEPLAIARLQAMGDYTAVRTRHFDDVLMSACENGIEQVVNLAAGLDARAWRIGWPPRTTMYEIDLPAVLAFKAVTLADSGAEPACRYVPLGVDLRQDWTAALLASGFDPSHPTAWLAEGLLPYLPAAAQDQLFSDVTSLSAPGSQLAVEAFGEDFYDAEAVRKRDDQLKGLGYIEDSDDAPVVRTQELFYLERRANVAEWLTEVGWRTTAVPALDLMQRYGRRPDGETADAVIKSVFVDAHRLGG